VLSYISYNLPLSQRSTVVTSRLKYAAISFHESSRSLR
jgi:hypothetical protein